MIRTTLLAASAVLSLAGQAAAEGYTLFVYEPASEIALRTDPGAAGAAYWADWGAYSAALAEIGAIRGGAPLMPAGDGTGDAEALSGYFILDVDSADTATELAAMSPTATRGGRTVVVPHFAAPGMDN